MHKSLALALLFTASAQCMMPPSFKDPALAQAYEEYYSSNCDLIGHVEHLGGEHCITAKHYRPQDLTYRCGKPEIVDGSDDSEIRATITVSSKTTDESFEVDFGHQLDEGFVRLPIIRMQVFEHSRIVLHTQSCRKIKKERAKKIAAQEAFMRAIAQKIASGGGAAGADNMDSDDIING